MPLCASPLGKTKCIRCKDLAKMADLPKHNALLAGRATMSSIRKMVAMGAVAILLATAAPELPEPAEAGMPAPLPTQIPIRDISTPPAPGMTPGPVMTRSTTTKRHRHVKRTRKHHTTRRSARARTRTQKPSAPPAQNSTGPKLEQRFEAPTESIYPLGPDPARKATSGQKNTPLPFPPDPSPAPAPAPASVKAPVAAPAPAKP